ncbi:hypothetical protein EDC96DRAFT_569224 [Choanephora cucurbitarum]|nr:hypothetical protein EDC96DRAFT_569224 [Choanephora cucurbitarum]
MKHSNVLLSKIFIHFLSQEPTTFKIPKRKELEKVILPPCKCDSIIEDYTNINPQCDFYGSDFEGEVLQLLMQLEHQKYLNEKERPFKYLKSKQKHLANAALTYCKVLRKAKLKSDQNFNDTLRFSLVPAVGVLFIAEDLYGTKPKYDDNEISCAYMIMDFTTNSLYHIKLE